MLGRVVKGLGGEGSAWRALATLVPVAVVMCAYLVIQTVLTQNIGLGVHRVADNALYTDTVRRIQIGLAQGDLRYAFSGSTYAYGSLYFLLLAAASLPAAVLGIEPLFLYSMQFVNPALFVGSLVILYVVMRRVWPVAWSGRSAWFWPLALALCLSMRTLHMMLVHLHPELLQAFLLVAGIWALQRHHEHPGFARAGIAGAIFGLLIAAKISSVLFFAAPGAYFALRVVHDRRFVVNAAEFAALCLVAGIVAAALVDPLAWADTSRGFSRFAGEYRFFSKSLGVSAIAEYDKTVELGSRFGALKAWLYAPYNHGLVPALLFYPMLLATAWWAFRNEVSRSERFPLASLAVILHLVVFAFYLLKVTRVTSYYLLPTMLLLLPVGAYCVWEMCAPRRLAAAVVSAVALLCVVLNAGGVITYLQTNLLDRNRDYLASSAVYEPIRQLLRDRQIPLGRVMVDRRVPLNLGMAEIGFLPADPDDVERYTPFAVHRLAALRPGAAASEVVHQDTVILSKLSLPILGRMTSGLEAQGMRMIYEDAAVRVMSAFPPATPFDLSAGSAALVGGSDGGPIADLRWTAPRWEGMTRRFAAPLDLSAAAAVVLDVTVEGPLENGVLRVILQGSRLDRPEGPALINQWHAMAPHVVAGRQRIRISRSDFAMISLPEQWGYVTAVAMGGTREPGARVTVHSIVVESGPRN